jgi:Mg2+ and Co2+ transporter CorA
LKLFGLLTHEDAIANINLASYSAELAAASTKIAEATKKDSSAMKTIAVMTMVFLPATFFAALFSVPSLQWDKPVVIQDKFWIYWAFAVPSTLLVFVIWGLVTNRDLIQRRIRRLLHGDTKARMD